VWLLTGSVTGSVTSYPVTSYPVTSLRTYVRTYFGGIKELMLCFIFYRCKNELFAWKACGVFDNK
jgi:hypothetical protein